MTDLVPRYVARATLADQGNGALAFTGVPAAGVAAALTPFYKGDKGDKGDTGGNAAVIAQAVVDLPFSKGGTSTINVASASVTPSSKIMPCLVATEENEVDDIDDWAVTATPQAGSIDFHIYCPGPICGQVAINYMIG